MTSSIANCGDSLPPLMRKAGFRYVFLGIENVLEEDLVFLRASAKNARREGGRSAGNATVAAIDKLHAAGLSVVGGIIVGNPNDTRESIEANLTFARRYVDWPYIQHPTPYPGTPMTAEFRTRGLVVNERVEEYDGTTAVVKTEHLESDEIEFIRWRAERWMKVRHLPSVLRHYPRFVLRNAPRMCAHTFRGSSLRSLIGLESQRQVFARYKRLRAAEREVRVRGRGRIEACGPSSHQWSSPGRRVFHTFLLAVSERFCSDPATSSRARNHDCLYRIERLLGEGGFGQVFLATTIGRAAHVPETVCIKASVDIDAWLREAVLRSAPQGSPPRHPRVRRLPADPLRR